MGGYRVLVASFVVVLAACGGGKKVVVPPQPEKKAEPPKETEADREKKRHDEALKIVPEGSNCLPAALKDEGAPRLEVAASGADAILCAVDTDKSRLAGPVGCWKIDLKNTSKDNVVPLIYQDPAPLPGHSVAVTFDDGCARGYCLPKESKASAKTALMAWNLDKSKVAVLVGDEVHVFDAARKSHESSFGIRGEKGLTNDPVGIYFVGDAIFVEGADQGSYSAVWVFKAADGAAVGPINILGGKDEKPVSTYHGSVSVLDPGHVALADHGMETLTTYEIETGKRTKSVRKIPKLACKPDEVDAYWHDGDKVTDKCKDAIGKASGFLVGATAVMGSKNLLVVLRGDRLGELGIIDPKSLAESKKALKMPWCEAGGAPGGEAASTDKKADKNEKKKAKDEKESTSRGGKPKKGGDPEDGGE